MVKTILIVEDNEINLRFFDDLLQAEGYHTLKSKDGVKVVEMVKEYFPDLVLMDIKLPKTCGFEIVGKIKSQKRIRYIPIIAVTALAMEEDKQKILASGFDSYISKPMSVSHFLSTIRRYLV